MSRQKKIILHVGTPKTGTTALQGYLAKNRERLSFQNNITYYKVGDALSQCHWWFATSFHNSLFDWRPVKNDLLNGLSRQSIISRGENSLRSLQDELKSHDTVIISAEHFFFLPEIILKRIRDYFLELKVEVDIVLYVRNILDCSISELNQKVKSGSGKLSDFENELPRFPLKKGILKFVQVFGENRVKVRNFSNLKGNDIVADFCNEILGLLIEQPKKKSLTNSSLSHEALCILDSFDQMYSGFNVGSAKRKKLISSLEEFGSSQYMPSRSLQDKLYLSAEEDINYIKKSWGFDLNDFEQYRDASESKVSSFMATDFAKSIYKLL